MPTFIQQCFHWHELRTNHQKEERTDNEETT